MNRSEEEQKVADNLFDKLRDDLLSRDLSNTENYDKVILTLSASSLGLSLTAIKFIVPITTALNIFLLKSAWALLVVSIICSLVAYLISNKALAVQLNNARDYYKNGIDDAFSRKNKYVKLNSSLNLATGLSFSIAIIFIVIFITINTKIGDHQMAKNSNTNIKVEKSANVPSMESIPITTTHVGNSANIPTMEQAPAAGSTSESSSSSGNKK